MDARDFLMGSSNPGFSFNTPGQRIVGKIIAPPRVEQQRVFGKQDLAFWPSGDPKLQMLVSVSTPFRNYEGIATPDRSKPDNGNRTIYVKGKHMEKAAKQAILAAGADFLDVGGWLDITYTGDDMSSNAGQKPKLFAVRYQAPAPGAAPSPTGPGGPHSGYQPPAQPGPAVPDWQQPDWRPAGPAVPQPYPPAQPGYASGGHPAYTQDPWTQNAPAAPAGLPAHHEQGPPPDWTVAPAQPVSAAPASAQPAMSTLEAIRLAKLAAQTADGEPPF